MPVSRQKHSLIACWWLWLGIFSPYSQNIAKLLISTKVLRKLYKIQRFDASSIQKLKIVNEAIVTKFIGSSPKSLRSDEYNDILWYTDWSKKKNWNMITNLRDFIFILKCISKANEIRICQNHLFSNNN